MVRTEKSLLNTEIESSLVSGCHAGSRISDMDDCSSDISGHDNQIDCVLVSSHHYPENFANELQANLNYFKDGVGVSAQSKIPFDNILLSNGEITPASYANSTAIGLYLNILVEMQRAGDNKAATRLGEVITRLEQAPKWNGLFYWLYDLDNSGLAAPDDGVISAVDNGNLALSLATIVGAFHDDADVTLAKLAQRSAMLLDNKKHGWSRLYDPSKGLLRAGWDPAKGAFIPYHIDRKANESRLATIWAVLATADMGSQAVPVTAFTDMELITAEYNKNGHYLEPMLTWDGSYFQALLPALWLDEASLMPDYQIVRDFSAAHQDFADKHNIPFASASTTINNGYAPYGLKAVSESYLRFNNDIHSATTGTPHALALYALLDKKDAIDRLLAIKQQYPAIESHAGWFDAIDDAGNISNKIIGLDQGMFVAAFLSQAIRADVKAYLDQRGSTQQLEELYQSFLSDAIVGQS
ncbi:hypothetical protein L4D76_12770 [Photobacterium sagamiensis]|uniref:hypothetical protein n=1 Tax=Photobacterium sagamiensis TaxID=2910241 RepID=UPI003D142BDA